jgi:hypothetical protein
LYLANAKLNTWVKLITTFTMFVCVVLVIMSFVLKYSIYLSVISRLVELMWSIDYTKIWLPFSITFTMLLWAKEYLRFTPILPIDLLLEFWVVLFIEFSVWGDLVLFTNLGVVCLLALFVKFGLQVGMCFIEFGVWRFV